MIKTKAVYKSLAVLVAAVFFCQNCATLITRRSKEIPVTSSPAGARITVDGESAGQTPVVLKLKKSKGHIIRVEAPGYNPLEIRIKRKISFSTVLSVVGNLGILGWLGPFVALRAGGIEARLGIPPMISVCVGSDEMVKRDNLILLGLFLGVGCGILIDALTGANSTLSPAELNVTLTEIEGQAQPGIIILDADEVQNIKWIRVKLAGSDRENEVLSLDFVD